MQCHGLGDAALSLSAKPHRRDAHGKGARGPRLPRALRRNQRRRRAAYPTTTTNTTPEMSATATPAHVSAIAIASTPENGDRARDAQGLLRTRPTRHQCPKNSSATPPEINQRRMRQPHSDGRIKHRSPERARPPSTLSSGIPGQGQTAPNQTPISSAPPRRTSRRQPIDRRVMHEHSHHLSVAATNVKLTFPRAAKRYRLHDLRCLSLTAHGTNNLTIGSPSASSNEYPYNTSASRFHATTNPLDPSRPARHPHAPNSAVRCGPPEASPCSPILAAFPNINSSGNGDHS